MDQPKHMDVTSRNERLLATLEGMGLYVRPIHKSHGSQEIDCLIVSAGLPTTVIQCITEAPASRTVAQPVPSTKVDEGVTAAEGDRGNVVDFPTVV